MTPNQIDGDCGHRPWRPRRCGDQRARAGDEQAERDDRGHDPPDGAIELNDARVESPLDAVGDGRPVDLAQGRPFDSALRTGPSTARGQDLRRRSRQVLRRRLRSALRLRSSAAVRRFPAAPRLRPGTAFRRRPGLASQPADQCRARSAARNAVRDARVAAANSNICFVRSCGYEMRTSVICPAASLTASSRGMTNPLYDGN